MHTLFRVTMLALGLSIAITSLAAGTDKAASPASWGAVVEMQSRSPGHASMTKSTSELTGIRVTEQSMITPSEIAGQAQSAFVLGDQKSIFGAGETGGDFDDQLKSIANGLYMYGPWRASWANGTVSLTLNRIYNTSTTRTSGTLRLELWASTVAPARGQGFSGYRLAVFSTLNPLPPGSYYYDISRTSSFTYPPDGTYWLVLALTEYSSTNCNAADFYCITDSIVSDSQETFGTVTSPTRTVISQTGQQCYQGYPTSALALLQQVAPGLFQAYMPTTSCASLGMSYFAGYLTGSAGLVSVYTPNSGVAALLCLGGAVTGCTGAAFPTNFTDLWWNPNESGWGLTVLHHTSGIAFVVWYTYDSVGRAKWYFASSCPFNGNSCTGTLYEASGPPFGPTFNSAAVSLGAVGYINLSFSNSNSGQMFYSVNGISGVKAISRLAY